MSVNPYPSYHQGFYQRLVFHSSDRVDANLTATYGNPEYRFISLPQDLANTHYLKVQVEDIKATATINASGDDTHLHVSFDGLQPLNEGAGTGSGVKSEALVGTPIFRIDTQSHGKFYSLEQSNPHENSYLLFRFEDWNNATIKFRIADGTDNYVVASPNQGAENYCIVLGFTAIPRNMVQPII